MHDHLNNCCIKDSTDFPSDLGSLRAVVSVLGFYILSEFNVRNRRHGPLWNEGGTSFRSGQFVPKLRVFNKNFRIQM